MITLVHHGGDRFTEIPYTGTDDLPLTGWFWLDVLTEDPDEILAIGTALGFDPLSIDDVATDMLPKFDTFDDYLYLVCHGLAFTDQRIGTVEFDMFIGDRMLVTFRPADVHGITWMHEHRDAIAEVARRPAELAARIIEIGSHRFPGLIDALEERIEELEDRAMRADNAVIGAAQALRRDVIVLRRVFGPQRDVLQRLSWEESLDARVRRAFADVFDHHFRFVESLDSARALIGSIQETHRGAIAARTNEVMKVLTVFSAIMLPLTLLAGIWGMNVDLPFDDSPDAFLIVGGGMAAVAIGLWLYFAWRGFVGGIRLSRIPKAVGLTIAHLTAPVRPRPTRPTELASGDPTNDQVNP
ncbi:MAG: magnesium transporter CorA family protein [Acidimicrobiia bacterium]